MFVNHNANERDKAETPQNENKSPLIEIKLKRLFTLNEVAIKIPIKILPKKTNTFSISEKV